MTYHYTWREPLDSQLGRIKQHCAADVQVWAKGHGAKLGLRDWMELNVRLEQFAADCQKMRQEADKEGA